MKSRILIALCAMALLALPMTMGCGGSGGGGGDSSVTYDGNTSPAVADSTNASQITENVFNTVSAGFPLAQAFLAQPQLQAQPQIAYYTTTVTVPIPAEAVLDGSSYADSGTGTATLSGTMTLYLFNYISDSENSWSVDYVSMSGSVEFQNFRAENSGPTLTGKATLPQGEFHFSNEVNFLFSTMDFDGEPGLPIWDSMEMTFSKLTLQEGSDTYYLGEGDWVINGNGESVSLAINSMTVKAGAETYKLEDTLLEMFFSSSETSTSVETYISGTDSDYGTFYDFDHGMIYFAGSVYEEDPPNEIVGGDVYLSADGYSDDAEVYFGYDDVQEATFYNVRVDGELVEKGWFVDGVFTPDPFAPSINT